MDSFATFFLLSHVQFLNVASDLLTPVQVFQISLSSQQLTHSWRLFYDADVVYFGKQHLPYAVLAIVGGAFFVLLPVTILLLYLFRCFQRVLQVFPGRWYVLHTFVDSFQGCFKDGTMHTLLVGLSLVLSGVLRYEVLCFHTCCLCTFYHGISNWCHGWCHSSYSACEL